MSKIKIEKLQEKVMSNNSERSTTVCGASNELPEDMKDIKIRDRFVEKHLDSLYAKEYNPRKLEEVLFLVTDLLHNASHNKIPIETVEEIMIKARLFTRYAKNREDSNLLKEQDDFIKFLKNEMWVKVYGDTFEYFNSQTVTHYLFHIRRYKNMGSYDEVANYFGVTEKMLTEWQENNSLEILKKHCKKVGIYDIFFTD